MKQTRVLLVGPRGHGRWHLRNIRDLHDRGVRLVGVHEQRPDLVERDELIGDATIGDDLPRLLRNTAPDITIVCTPIHTHVSLALQAIEQGSAVLVEKPPAPTLAEYDTLAVGANGAACQVGFQSLGSAAIGAVRDALRRGEIGDLRGIGGAGTWIRDASYFHRSPWAGRRFIDGVPVMDGVLTNPFAHAVATALRLTDGIAPAGLASVEVDPYRAHDIESDDCSAARLTTSTGTVITVAATLCPEIEREPRLELHGTRGTITLWYTKDTMTVHTERGVVTRRYPRTDLLANLVDHLADPSVALLAPLAAQRPFMQFMDAVATGPEPRVIPDSAVTACGTGGSRRLIVNGIDAAIERSTKEHALFRELGLPWTGAAS